MLACLMVAMLGLCPCSGEFTPLENPVLYVPFKASVNAVVEFQCQLRDAPQDEYILFRLFKDSKLVGEYSSFKDGVGTFLIVAQLSDEGSYECEASVQNNSAVASTVSNSHYLTVIKPVEGAKVEVHSGATEFFEGRTLQLRCTVSSGNYVSFRWLLNNQFIQPSPFNHPKNDSLFIYRTSSADSGLYACIATNRLNETKVFTSISPNISITVKESVLDLEIFFTVLKEDTGNYSAVVTCESTGGIQPIIFSLYNHTNLIANTTSDHRKATFKVPLVFGEDLEAVQCQASKVGQISQSHWLPLKVDRVGGPVEIYYDYEIGWNYGTVGIRLYCQVAKGSHPLYRWFLDGRLLSGRGTFYWVVEQPPEHSILLLSVGHHSGGTYHCEVSDSFDSTNAINSTGRYFNKKVLYHIPVLMVTVVFAWFTFFLFLVLVCLIAVMLKGRQQGENAPSQLEMERVVAEADRRETVSRLDLSKYQEDEDVVHAARFEEFDQASLASEEDMTIEEEPAVEEAL